MGSVRGDGVKQTWLELRFCCESEEEEDKVLVLHFTSLVEMK